MLVPFKTNSNGLGLQHVLHPVAEYLIVTCATCSWATEGEEVMKAAGRPSK